VSFHVENKIVTHKSVYFNKDQIHPSITKCYKGRCVLLLCRIAEANGTVPEKIYDPSMEGNDPLIGKLVKILSLGGISFHDPDGCEEDLDVNWKRLRNMAQPVVDKQLAKLAMEGKWKIHRSKLIWAGSCWTTMPYASTKSHTMKWRKTVRRICFNAK
jgi:hypothetical protein